MRPRLVPILCAAALPALAQFEFFEARIRPVLVERCYGCHGEKASGGLRLDSKEGWERGGSRGPAVIPGNPEASPLFKAISHKDASLRMPPPGKLPDTAIEDFREWIRHGAEDPREDSNAAPAPSATIDWDRARRHWSLQPVRPGAVPKPRNQSWIRTPVDAFLLQRLEQEGLAPAAPVDRRALLRRVTFDLTGLPPTPAEVAAFVADTGPDAYRTVVERLLSSPHYGERWARHWLDLVRFAETNGHEFDFYKYEAWRYRDYVIRAFNDDVPYDRFVREHIAGDLPAFERSLESRIASGFWGLGEERNGATDLEEVRTEMRDSRIDVFGKTFLGLTIACARCHDHKFDPIPTDDYYALGGILDSTRTTLASVATPAALRETELAIESGSPPPAPAWKPPALRPGDELIPLDGFYRGGSAFASDVSGRLDSSRGVSDKLTGIMVSRSFRPTRRYLHVRVAGTKFGPVREKPSLLAVTIFAPGRYPKGVAGDGDRTLRWKTVTLKEEINQVCHLEIADRLADGHIVVDALVLSNSKEPPPNPAESLPPLAALATPVPVQTFARVSYEDVPVNMRVHVRGNHHKLGAEAPRRFLRILGGDDPAPYAQGSGRAALARALTEPGNPLLARVMVNRMWRHHFGEGLVRTVDNFGRTGERPSHPELLDWLAHEFAAGGWSIKAMHRIMVMSNAYRMDSLASAEAEAKDPRNRLLSHMPVRRLDAESIRDAILAVAGSLDPKTGGPSVPPHISPFQDGRGKPESGPLDGAGRRSVYLEVRRNFLSPLLLAFDYPLPTATAGRRSLSSVPAQALALMNNEFVAAQASAWAAHASAEHSDPRARLDAMFLRAYSRTPNSAERDRIQTFLRENTWEDVAHVLFNSKEFLFVR